MDAFVEQCVLRMREQQELKARVWARIEARLGGGLTHDEAMQIYRMVFDEDATWC